MESKTVRTEIPGREWMELTVTLEGSKISKAQFKVWGCFELIQTLEKASKALVGQDLLTFQWSGNRHSDLLFKEAILKLIGTFQLPYTEVELCHCRKIPTQKVDSAIVLGAHTPEKVKKWTSAGSGCGTCRADTQSIIDFRLSNGSSGKSSSGGGK